MLTGLIRSPLFREVRILGSRLVIMKRIIATFFGIAATVIQSHATQANWINGGVTNVVVPIDATNVINNAGGLVSVFSSPLPFDTSNTQNFTNSGTMNGSVGFRFDTAPRDSIGNLVAPRRLAANFHNRNTGVVAATDGSIVLDPLLGFTTGSYLLVHATNLINQGTLSVGAGGLLQLVGTNVNISRSALAVNGLTGSSSFNNPDLGTFTPSVAITDNYWGQGNDTFNVTGIGTYGLVPVIIGTNFTVATNLVFSSPSHAVTNTLGRLTTTVPSPFNFFATNYNFVGAYTNAQNPTNLFRQAVFVRLASSNMGVNIKFSPSPQPTNFFRGVSVEIFNLETNIFTETTFTNAIYFSDTLASTTNRGLLENFQDGTSRPANYILSRSPTPGFQGGMDTNAIFTENFLFDPSFDSVESSGPYAGYSASLDNLPSRPPAIPSGDFTNNPGRIEIRADQLNMDKARIRTEGLLSIQANHLISSSNAVIDSENLSFNLTSTNGNLQVQSLMKEKVNRLRGDIYAWSATWTNSFTPAGSSNAVSLNFHVLIIDAQTLLDELPVTVYELRAKATNIVINDNATVVRTLLIQSDSLTLNGNLTLSGTIQNWTQPLVPTLKHFTNNGVLTIPNEAHFGDEGITPYRSFVNFGSIQSYGQSIRSDYAQLSGLNFAAASFSLQATNGQIDGGTIFANGAVTLAGDAIRLNQAWVDSGSLLEINVTNSLSDDGAASANLVSMTDGFYMSTKPATGDLLGTTVNSAALNFAQVNHVWAGRDDGVNITGFSNNVALGVLELEPLGVDPLFVFSGAGVANGLYVDLLDLSLLSDYASQLQIDPNLTIYYAAAILNTNAAPINGQSTEEYLDGQFGGRLRWVPGFAGPNSTTTVTINGNQIISVNLALRNSGVLDSDADGTVNGLDASPFDGVMIDSIQRNASPAGYLLTWDAAPSTLYQVEARTNLTTSAWSVLFTTTSTNAAVAPWTVLDTNAAPAGVTRYYRVTYSPNN
jgi:hypothetical protein